MTTATRRQRKSMAELKHPDLKGEYLCGSCNATFNHAASLNRHRVKCAEHLCFLCKKVLPIGQNLRFHMEDEHKLLQIYSCGCCGCSYRDKKTLNEHTKSIKRNGTPGSAAPIAKTANVNGETFPFKKTGSLSPCLSRASSEESDYFTATSTVVPKVEVQEEVVPENTTTSNEDINGTRKTLFNNSVDIILQSRVFSNDQLVLLKTWEKIFDAANQMVDIQLGRSEEQALPGPIKRLNKRCGMPPVKFHSE